VSRGGAAKESVGVRLNRKILARLDALVKARSRGAKRKVTPSEVLRSVIDSGLPAAEQERADARARAEEKDR
jgi:hypothetical protein